MAANAPSATPFTDSLAQIAKDVQDAAASMDPSGSTPTSDQIAGTQPPADPAKGAPPETPKPAPTAAPGTLGGKFKSEDEAIKAHHLLIHSLNATKAELDKERAKNAAASPPAPLSPGRADPAAQGPKPDDEKWRNVYGIPPEDVDARIRAVAAGMLTELEEPVRKQREADAYILQAYPDFPAKAADIKAFVSTNDVLNHRVADLWQKQYYAEAMEISYLAYDNALRTVQNAQAAGAQTQQAVDATRADATMMTSQAGGPRETTPDPNAYPRTPEDWNRIRAMQAAGRDVEVNRILYGHLIKDIPALNPRG